MDRVLIVEDEKKIRGVFKKILEAEGLEVLEAQDGEEATMILLQNKAIDLFLLDIEVPVVDGPSFFDAVKVFNPQAKVVVSSVHALDMQKNLIEGADDYYDKSEGADILVERVRKVLHMQPK